ncbi:hypothetical protein Patl1_06112 [Pistacia atlantica]|uniref:Uncharacterized protein n=1 Tax=Pistacia atlantica TaxID=434234 RepID=A0ACC1BVK1_9ROSI|nr:hypothetical protein Patl1_06112 [Pistacia atlantica]
MDQNPNGSILLGGTAQGKKKFIANISGKCQPFSRLMKKGMEFVWDQACQDAFESIKEYLTKPPVLAAPVPGRPFLFFHTARGLPREWLTLELTSARSLDGGSFPGPFGEKSSSRVKLLTVGVRFGGTVQLRNNLKRFGSPTLAASLSASASYYLDTFSRWGSWRQHGMHGQLALQVGPLWLIAQLVCSWTSSPPPPVWSPSLYRYQCANAHLYLYTLFDSFPLPSNARTGVRAPARARKEGCLIFLPLFTLRISICTLLAVFLPLLRGTGTTALPSGKNSVGPLLLGRLDSERAQARRWWLNSPQSSGASKTILVNAIRIGCLPQLPMLRSAAEALKGFVLGCRDQGTLSNGEICGGTNYKYIYFDLICFDTRDRPRSKVWEGKEGLIDKGAFKPFCWIVGPQPRPIE